MKNKNLEKAIEIVGLTKLANLCGVSHQAIRKWEGLGRLPRTDWTGETRYSEIIEKATNGKVTKSMLLVIKKDKAA